LHRQQYWIQPTSIPPGYLPQKYLTPTWGYFLPYVLDVSPHGLFSVPSGVNHAAPRRVCMVCCFFVVLGIVMLDGFSVEPCGMREMF
jgi:hypothetical protein